MKQRANWFSCKLVRSFCLFNFEECGKISNGEVVGLIIAVKNEKALIHGLPVVVLRIIERVPVAPLVILCRMKPAFAVSHIGVIPFRKQFLAITGENENKQ